MKLQNGHYHITDRSRNNSWSANVWSSIVRPGCSLQHLNEDNSWSSRIKLCRTEFQILRSIYCTKNFSSTAQLDCLCSIIGLSSEASSSLDIAAVRLLRTSSLSIVARLGPGFSLFVTASDTFRREVVIFLHKKTPTKIGKLSNPGDLVLAKVIK